MIPMTTDRDLEIIDTITKIRIKNNFPWMRLLEIALKHAPDETRAVLREIYDNDHDIGDLLRDLAK
jgi:hypothetical protein